MNKEKALNAVEKAIDIAFEKGKEATMKNYRILLFNEVYDRFVDCESDDEFTQYLNDNVKEL